MNTPPTHPLRQINNIPTDNLNALAQLFPSVVKDGEVDFQALREELGQFQEVDEKERYALTWTGKQEAKKEAQRDTNNRTLNYIPEDSKNPETTENLYIEGDNLEVLKLLRQNYNGSVKMIYIDPPYNTGKDFIYKDNFTMSEEENDIAEGNVDEEGNRLQVNSRTSNRYHANWLNMMYPRLKLAKDLLTEDGVIFISIDDNEQSNLKKVCDEVFGENNFISKMVWQSTAGSNTGTNIITVTEFLFCYSKSKSQCKFNSCPIDNEDKYILEDEHIEKRGRYVLNKLDRRMTGSHYSDALNFPITMPDGTGIYPGSTETKNNENWNYRWSQTKVQWGIDNDFLVFKKQGDKWSAYFKQYLKVDNNDEPINRSVPYQNFLKLEQFNSTQGTKEIMNLFGNKYFDYPKPPKLIQWLLSIVQSKDGIILDFFSGSASTAQAIMQLNAEDGGNRKYICVQIPEKTDEKHEAYKAGYKNICEIGKERIRRAGDKIKTEVEEANAQLKLDEGPKKVPDIGFKVFRASDTNIQWNLLDSMNNGEVGDEILTGVGDLSDFVLGAKDLDIVYELLLRQRNIPLTYPVETLEEVGKRTYLYAATILVCLEVDITESLTDKLAQLDPLPSKFIFRDSSFGMDINKKSHTFRLFAKQIDKYHPNTDVSYTIDFI